MVSHRSARPFELGNELTIVIPTINSARYLDIILSFYRDHGFVVTVFVDSRTADDTVALAKRFTETVVISTPAAFAEELIRPMSYLCKTPWILRLDDDELPTLAMMEFVRQCVQRADSPVHGFQRHQCAVSRDGRLLSHAEVSPYNHRQWRLFQPDQVKFAPELHTPGFEWEGMGGDGGPPEISMIHLDWALHTYEERRRKVDRYEAFNAEGRGAPQSYAYYLYEDQSWPNDRFRELAFPEFDRTCLEITDRFKELCVGF